MCVVEFWLYTRLLFVFSVNFNWSIYAWGCDCILALFKSILMRSKHMKGIDSASIPSTKRNLQGNWTHLLPEQNSKRLRANNHRQVGLPFLRQIECLKKLCCWICVHHFAFVPAQHTYAFVPVHACVVLLLQIMNDDMFY